MDVVFPSENTSSCYFTEEAEESPLTAEAESGDLDRASCVFPAEIKNLYK